MQKQSIDQTLQCFLIREFESRVSSTRFFYRFVITCAAQCVIHLIKRLSPRLQHSFRIIKVFNSFHSPYFARYLPRFEDITSEPVWIVSLQRMHSVSQFLPPIKGSELISMISWDRLANKKTICSSTSFSLPSLFHAFMGYATSN